MLESIEATLVIERGTILLFPEGEFIEKMSLNEESYSESLLTLA